MPHFTLQNKVLYMQNIDSTAPALAPQAQCLDRDMARGGATGSSDRRLVARRLLAHALMVGVAADALLRRGPTGIGFALWVAFLIMAAMSITLGAGRSVPREAHAWLATALLFASAIAWRDSMTLQFFDALAVVGSIAMAGVALADTRAALFAERLRDTIWALALLGRETAFGAIPLALRDAVGSAGASAARHRVGTAGRVTAVSGLLLFVFGSLLRSADPIFASLVSLPELDFPTLASHVVVIVFFGAVVAGWGRGALMARDGAARCPDVSFVRLGTADVTGALGTLLVLFAVFVAAQLGWLFGGERFLRERTGLTAAAYARQGFFQMMWVVALVAPLLVGTRAALDPAAGTELRRRHARLSLPIIVLLGIMIVSAILRMRLYVQYFGLTTDRLYPLVVIGWLAFVLVWLARTVLRDSGRPFAAGVAISGLVTLAALNAVSPDVVVARVNLRRAARLNRVAARRLDVRYLATLSGEAVELATRAALVPATTDAVTDSERCDATQRLLNRWGPSSRAARRLDEPGSWRAWNAGEAAALRVVGANARALRAVQHETCGRARGRRRTSVSNQR